MKNKLLIFLLIVFGHFGYAQTKDCDCFLKGKLVDEKTNEAIVGAIIQIKESKKTTLSDNNGLYQFTNLCEGKVIITAKIIGYHDISYLINLEHNKALEQNFSLKEDQIHLEFLEIKASKLESLTQNSSVINSKELFKKSGENFSSGLSGLTGVNLLQTGSSISKPVIHGLHSNRVLILNNGIRQEGQQWGSEHAPEIDPFVANKITVVKGANGLRYGADGIAGLILVEPKALNFTKKIELEANQVYQTNGNMLASSIILEKGLGTKLAFRIHGTIKKGGNVSSPSYKLANTGLQEFNYSTTLAYKSEKTESELYFSQFNSKIGVFSGSHLGNIQDLVNSILQEKPLAIYTPSKFTYFIDRPYQDIQHSLVKSKTNFRLKNNQKLFLTLGRQSNFRSEIDVLRGDRSLAQQFRLITYTGEFLLENKFKNLFSGMLGLNSMYQQNLSTGSLKNPLRSTVLIPNYAQLNLGFFAIERFTKNKTEIEAGLRIENRSLDVFFLDKNSKYLKNSKRFNTNPSGSLGFNYALSTKLKVNASLSTAWRPASVNELFSEGVHHGTATFEIGDTSLVPEFAYNRAVGVFFENKNLKAEINLYSNLIDNFIFINPTGRPVLTIRGAFPEFRYAQTTARFNGIDLNLQWKINSYLGYTNKSSFLRATDLSNKQALIYMPANKISNEISFDVNSKFLDDLSLEYVYVFRQNRVPTQLIFKDISESELIFKDFAGDFLAPPNAYCLMNLNLNKEFLFKNKSRLNTNFAVKNMLNTRYRDYLNRFRYFSDEQGINLIFRCKYYLN